MDNNVQNSVDQPASETAPLPEKEPFEEIALALSGGGYRAAAFHLGTLDMLHRLDLLKSVHVLSTVSGGTLTGLKYALSTTEGTPFEQFYDSFYSFLGDTNVIDQGLAGLQPPADSPFSGQMPSLIRSAAEVYTSDRMVGNKTFDTILNDHSSHLREASFNATEFRTGNYFRFQKSASPDALIGNRNLVVKREVAGMIRLADIAAASSCFPSAFEPLRFPDDFLWPKKIDEVRDLLGENFRQCVPLMDGGIYDNQGVDSIIRAYSRGKNQIGLLIISDTTQREPSLFEFSPSAKRGWPTISTLTLLAKIVFLVSLITTIILIVAATQSIKADGFRLVDLFLFGVPILLSGFLAGGLWWIRSQYKEGEQRVAEMTTVELWPFLKRLTVPELIDLISGRAKSLIALTSSVFLKRVRALVYKDINLHKRYRKRQFSSLIYDLAQTSRFGDEIVKALQPERFRELAVVAEKVPTSLWSNNDEEMRNLIACGQVTICFNLLHYIMKERSVQLNTSGTREEEIYQRALAAWETLSNNQYAFLRNQH
jgi:predicted acylesterase/phospholipase RssA